MDARWNARPFHDDTGALAELDKVNVELAPGLKVADAIDWELVAYNLDQSGAVFHRYGHVVYAWGTY